jgi:hypothetical protein
MLVFVSSHNTLGICERSGHPIVHRPLYSHGKGPFRFIYGMRDIEGIG